MWNPFSDDNDSGRMSLSEALLKAQDDYHQPFESEEMTAVKKAKAPAATKKVVKKEAPVEATKTAGVPRGTPEGHVGLNELATELETTPAVLRRRLRGLEGVSKPEGQHGWYWKDGSKELASVRKSLSKAE